MTDTSTLSRFRVLPVTLALLMNVVFGPIAPVIQTAMGASGPSVDNYSQCQIGNPSSGLDCEGWINGILNATHNNYSEDEVVPQRLVMDFGASGSHTITLRYMTRKDSSGQRHAYDYLATWNHSYVNADRCQDLNPASLCVGGSASAFDIPSDPNSVSPGGPQPTSAHELPQADRHFVSYGGAVTAATTPVHAVDPGEAGSDYASITLTVNVTDSKGAFMLLFGGHLAAGFGPRGWGEGLGAASISGGPYHVILDAIDGEAIGSRDNQIMSNAIQPVPEPSLEITKTADDATVNAGEQIGFTISVHNAGPGEAKNATLSDPLPAGSGVDWSENPDSSACSISGTPPSETLNCSFGDLAAGATASVHVVSATTADSCGEYANTATADADNFDPVMASDSTTVLCADLDLQKTPDGGTVNAGDDISFTLTLTNNGEGGATNVDIDDALPAGFSWSESPDTAECSISGGALHCDIASLAKDASFSVTVSAATDADDCAKVTNHATADADNHARVSNDGDVTVECANVGVEKTGNGPIDAGDKAEFSIVVSASGNADSTNVTLNDDLPAGISWSLGSDGDEAACSIDTSADPDQLACDFGSMSPDDTKTVVLSGTANAGSCPSISNTATVDSDFDTDASDDSDSATITVNCGDIVLEKTPDAPSDNGGTVNAGGTATFTIMVRNDGTGTARGVAVSDQLPDVSGTWSVDNANCSIDGSDLLTCSLGDLGAGASVTLHVSTTVTSADCGTLSNPLAEVTTTNDGSSQNSGSIEVTCPALSISKTTDTPEVTAGDVVHYTINVDNSTASGTAEDVTVSDSLPSGLAWSEDSDDCSITGSDLSCGPMDIPAGSAFSVTLTGTTDAGDCPSISNTASFDSANAGSGDTESAPTVISVNCPDVSVIKTAGEPTVSAGDEVSYDITVNAAGSGDSTNVELSDELPVGIDWGVSGTDAADCSIDDSSLPAVLHCDFGSMQSGDSASITLSGTAGPEDCGTLDNTAVVAADVDVNARNNSAGPVAIDVNCPDVSVVKSGSGVVTAGDAIHYTIDAANDGDGDAYDFELADTLPDVSGGWSLEAGAPAFCELNGNDLSCSLDVFEAGASFSVTLNAVSSNADCGDLENTATVSASNEAQSATEDNHSSHTITVNCPNLTITKSADNGTISAGDLASYTIVVANEGPGTATNVHLEEDLPDGVSWEVEVADPIPAGVSCASSMADDRSQSASCDFASLAEGESVTILVSGLTDTADCGMLRNLTSVSGDNENPANLDDNQASADVVVLCPGINIAKTNDQEAPVLPGTNVTYTLLVTLTEQGTAHDVTVVDTLPEGLDAPTDVSDGGSYDASTRTITWDLGDLDAAGSPLSLTYQAKVGADVENGTTLRNVAVVFSPNTQCPDVETLGPECEDDSDVTVRVPALIIDKAADREVVDVTAGDDTTVTWTLTYTLTDGPVTDAVITDPIPSGLNYVDGSASDGGTFDAATRSLSWTFATLSASGSVTFDTTVDASIGGGVTLDNVATVDSAETAPDSGEDSIRTVEQEEQGSTGTPKPSVPNTAFGTTPVGQPVKVPVELMLLVFMSSLGGLVFANVKAVRRRR